MSALPPIPAGDDDFLAAIRIDHRQQLDAIGVKKLLTTVPLRKPNKTEWVRVHPEHQLNCYLLERKAERETYVVSPPIAHQIPEFVTPVQMRLTVNKLGLVFIWPLRQASEARRHDHWQSSAEEAASQAMRTWVQVRSNMSLGAYELRIPTGDYGDPCWPEESWGTIMRIGLQGWQIQDLNHPVVRDLLGRT